MKKLLIIIPAVLIMIAAAFSAQALENNGMFLVSPMAGTINCDVKFNTPGTGSASSINDSGPLEAISMIYACPRFTLGSMAHFSTLNKSTENGYLFYGLYNFLNGSNIYPTVGFYSDYISVYTKATSDDVAPLNSMNIDSSIWGLHAIAGMTFKVNGQKVMPFIGYFNEEVGTSFASEGMIIGGQTQYGFAGDASAVLNYMTAGIKADLMVCRCVRLDAKIYDRFSRGEQGLFTARTRLDLLLSKQAGISVKYDYFDDVYEKDTFAMIGPFFVF